MSNNKGRVNQKCTLCGSRVANSRKKPGDCRVLETVKELNIGDIDEVKVSAFVMCNKCRDEADVACEFIKRCRASVIVQPEAGRKKFKDANTQTKSPERIIIVNQLSPEIDQNTLEDTFSQYGIIAELYLRPDPGRYEDDDIFARITFSTGEEALRVMEAAQSGTLRYDNEPLIVTRVSEDTSPIDALPNACLAEVFLHIDYIEDKVAIGKVCKRWKQVLATSWSNITELSDSFELKGMKTIEGLRPILKGCGRFLNRLKFNISDFPVSRLKLISENCENLENLQLELNCENRTRIYHHEVLSVFQQCTKLQRLYIKNLDQEFDYSHFENLPTKILEIHLFGKNPDTRASMNLSKFKDLEALALGNFHFRKESLKGIENLDNLKYLSLIGSRVHSSNIRKIQNFWKLRHLAIPSCGIDDGILSHIVQKNLNLEYLDISDNRSITDRSFQHVPRLTKLKNLYMKNLLEVAGSNLTEIHTLKELDVEGCSSITDWTLMIVIDKSEHLWHLYAVGVATWRLLINAEETFKLGRAGRDFYICVDDRLVERWHQSAKDCRPVRVFKNSRSSKVGGWRGWQGDVNILI